jgi:hypothetical protein
MLLRTSSSPGYPVSSATIAIALVSTLLTGCIAPGQSKAVTAASLTKRASQGVASKQGVKVTEAAVASPIVEVVVCSGAYPAITIEQEGKGEDLVQAGLRAWDSRQKGKIRPKLREEAELQLRVQWTNALAAEHLDRMSEIHHGLEAVTALRERWPSARVFLSISDGSTLTEESRNFSKLTEPQWPATCRPNDWRPGLSEWVGHYHQSWKGDSPAGLTLVHDLDRATDAQVALDSGGTYGRALGVVCLAHLGGSAEPVFVSSDSTLSASGATKPWLKLKTLENTEPSARDLKRARKQVSSMPFDTEWLQQWFRSAPTRDQWVEYQAMLRARSAQMGGATLDVRRASMFTVEKASLQTNAISVEKSPFLPYYSAMAAAIGSSLSPSQLASGQAAQLRRWSAAYDSTGVNVDGLLDWKALPAGSRERTLGSFLHAELQLREKVTDYLIREHYSGDLGNIVRGLQVEEEAVASKIKRVRGVAIAVAVVGAGVGAGGAAVGVASASAGNLAAAQTAQMTVNSINNSINSTIAALASVEGSLAARSRSLSVTMAEVIGPLEVELGGETLRLTADSVSDLRSKLHSLYRQRFP